MCKHEQIERVMAVQAERAGSITCSQMNGSLIDIAISTYRRSDSKVYLPGVGTNAPTGEMTRWTSKSTLTASVWQSGDKEPSESLVRAMMDKLTNALAARTAAVTLPNW